MFKKMLCLIFCTLVITTIFPMSVLSTQLTEINKLMININPQEKKPNEVQSLATPGYMSTPRHTSIVTKTEPYHSSVEVGSRNDLIIQMIEEVDDSLVQEYLEGLVDFGPRVTETSQCIAAAEYIYEQYESMGLDVEYHPWSNGGYSSNNVVATLPGTDPDSDEIYIVCGHYDTVSGSPGADDDGSGTITAMAAAYILSQYAFENTIKFIAWSGEEEGLLGSEVYAQQAFQNGDNIAGVLNADMIGYATDPGDEDLLKIYEDGASEWLYQFTYDINELYNEYIGLDLIHSGYTWGSDHNSFWDYGFDALFYQEYHFSEVYHSPQDTIENMNIPYTTKGVKLITATLAELAIPPESMPPEQPTLIGPTDIATNEEYTYTVSTTEPDGEDVYYYIDWGDETNTNWIGPYDSGQEVTITNEWSLPGEYNVRARAKDINDVVSKWSNKLIVTVVIDTPPLTPTITGIQSGKPGVDYNYQFSSTDPENDNLYYYIDWDDGTYTDWIGPYVSGEIASTNHSWAKRDTYTIKVKAKDIYGLESGWGYLGVKIPRSKIVNNPIIQFLEQHPNIFPIIQKLLNRLNR